ncbi:glycosyltransferase [uncultured Pluralibacter sp.]|uniref:glycosyltransferase family 8 protein n=1 Tax=uncultured Pluralibacter sp. TaxID=1490864 RepID=UPI00263694D7|nr:glycosyltransferase [uncultured Pluralibacter sp.]
MLNYSLRDSIKKTTVLGDRTLQQQDNLFHITYGTDANYQLGVGISIVSVLINNADRRFVFHIFTEACSDEYLSNLDEIARKYSTLIVIYDVDAAFFTTLPSTKAWSHAMYYRLLAYEYLDSQTDRVLYLDADVICAGNLSAFAEVDFGESIAVVVDDLPGTKARSIERLGSLLADREHYFNSGVMCVNLKEWHAQKLTHSALEMLLSSDYGAVIKYPDQDVLNVLLSRKLIYFPRRFNTVFTLKSELKDKTHQKYLSVITDDTVLVHYTGITKPWHAWADYRSRDVFNNAWQASPWRDSPLQAAKSRVEMQKAYKHQFTQGHYLSGIMALIRYKIKKIL